MIDASDSQPLTSPAEHYDRGSPEHYRGSFAGLSLLKRVHNLCRRVSGMQIDPNGEMIRDDFAHAFDVQPPGSDSTIPWEAFALLPPKDSVDQAIDVVIRQACYNLQFLHGSSLRQIAREVYNEIEAEDRHHARKPLALLYAILALGRRFNPAFHKKPDATAQGIANGLRYFRASRAMLDPADCHDLISL